MVMPILQTLTEVICNYLNTFNGKVQEKISNSNLVIAKTQCEINALDQGEDLDCCGQPMGFHLDDCEC
jgi:hypothetical protein